jgi:hypothetical protein
VPGGFTWAESALIGFGMMGRAELFFVVLQLCYVEHDIMDRDMVCTFAFVAMLMNISVPVTITLYRPVFLRYHPEALTVVLDDDDGHGHGESHGHGHDEGHGKEVFPIAPVGGQPDHIALDHEQRPGGKHQQKYQEQESTVSTETGSEMSQTEEERRAEREKAERRANRQKKKNNALLPQVIPASH